MKLYQKLIDGYMQYKEGSEIVLHKEGMQIFNPTEDMILEDGWVEYVQQEVSNELTLEDAIRLKLQDLVQYDESSNVNDCIITYKGQELHYWANKMERDSLKGAVSDFLSLDRYSYRLDLRELGVAIQIPSKALLNMLIQLECYAADCYNKTTDHQFAIKQLTSIEEVTNYDFTVGYPEKLNFTLDNI